MKTYRSGWLLAAIAILAILVATLHTAGSSVPRGWSFNLASGQAAFAEIIQNLLLFIPLGAGLALAWGGRRALAVVLIGGVLSFTVEFAQQWIPGRDPSVGDVICNTLSTAIGWAIVARPPRWITALQAAILAVAVWTATGILLRPVPATPPWSVIETPDWNYWGLYGGSANTTALTPTNIRIYAVAAPTPPWRASPLVAVVEQRAPLRAVRMIVIDEDDIALRYRTRAGDVTLEQPDLRWQHALAHIAPGDTFTVEAWEGKQRACISVNELPHCGLGYTVGDGWKLIFYPEHWSGTMLALINACWIGGWTLLVAAAAARRRREAVALIIIALVVIPLLTGLKATPVLEWLGALAGFGAMALLRSYTARRPAT